MATFLRIASVLVGLANLIVLMFPIDVVSALLHVVLAMVFGLVTSELALRWFRRQNGSENFSDRYCILVIVVCLGGTLMGGLLFPILMLIDVSGNEPLFDELSAIPVRILSLELGTLGAMFGFVLGLFEGLILAFPLAAVLGRFSNAS